MRIATVITSIAMALVFLAAPAVAQRIMTKEQDEKVASDAARVCMYSVAMQQIALNAPILETRQDMLKSCKAPLEQYGKGRSDALVDGVMRQYEAAYKRLNREKPSQ